MGKLAKLAEDGLTTGGFTDRQMLFLLLHSILLGLILVIATFYEVKTLNQYPTTIPEEEDPAEDEESEKSQESSASKEYGENQESGESGSPEKRIEKKAPKLNTNLEIFLGAAN